MISKYFLVAILILIAITAIATTTTFGQLEKETPPAPNFLPTHMNTTKDDLDIDIDIDPTDELPANGTVSIPTAGATDLDINEFPPYGVKVVIENQTVFVTNETVTIGEPADTLAAEADQQAAESNDDGGSSDSSDSSDEEE